MSHKILSSNHENDKMSSKSVHGFTSLSRIQIQNFPILSIQRFHVSNKWTTTSFYYDPNEALFELTQKGIVNSYLSKFEKLPIRIIGLPLLSLLNCFIFVFTLKISLKIQVLQPLSFIQIIC